jgi:acyl-CoA thioester hydrolase
MTFETRMTVRGYELDLQGHVGGAVYLNYAEHARSEFVRQAGVDHQDLLAAGIGPVRMEETIRYHQELRAGDDVSISCRFVWGDGATFQIEQEFRRADGTLVAELTGVGGLLDLRERRLVRDPRERWRSLARAPEVLGL